MELDVQYCSLKDVSKKPSSTPAVIFADHTIFTMPALVFFSYACHDP